MKRVPTGFGRSIVIPTKLYIEIDIAILQIITQAQVKVISNIIYKYPVYCTIRMKVELNPHTFEGILLDVPVV